MTSDQTPPPPPPLELIVDARRAPGDSSDGSGSAMAPVLGSVGAAALLAKFVAPWAGGVALVTAVVFLYLRKKPDHGRFVLRVVGSELTVTREKLAEPILTLPLEDILAVNLDRTTRAAGGGGRGGGGGGAPTERVRLMLERRAPAEPIYVPDEHVTPLEAQEWLAKVRVFLRKHQWTPLDEREPEPESAPLSE